MKVVCSYNNWLMHFTEVEAEASKLRRSSSSKSTEGKDDLVSLLRQTLLEEQLLSSDLKRKLQSVKKQNLALSQQLQEAKSQFGSPDTQFVSPNYITNISKCRLVPRPSIGEREAWE